MGAKWVQIGVGHKDCRRLEGLRDKKMEMPVEQVNLRAKKTHAGRRI